MAWFKVDDQMHGHPKTRRAGLEAMGLWSVAGSYCMAYKLDGHVDREWVESHPHGAEAAGKLVRVGLWHAAGHDCDACPQPEDPDGWVFHDWFDVQPSAEEIERKRENDRKRQRDRRAKLAGMSDDSPPGVTADVTQDVTRDTSVSHGTPSRPVPSRPNTHASHEYVEADRLDVERLCKHLAANLVANGCKPPTITKAWRDAARLLMDKDGHDEDAIHRCIDWTTADDFWRSNVLSMPKLRAKYDQLRLAAQRGQGASPRQQQTDDLFARAAERLGLQPAQLQIGA